MKNSSERKMFSCRLHEALATAGLSESPTSLTQKFNAVFTGPPVTSHAVRKWIKGETIPSQEKLQVLADMLGADSNWLRFGSQDWMNRSSLIPDSKNVEIIRDLQALDVEHRAMARELIRTLLRINKITTTRFASKNHGSATSPSRSSEDDSLEQRFFSIRGILVDQKSE